MPRKTLAQLDDEQRSAAEALVGDLPEPRRQMALDLAVEVLWQADKLKATRRQIGSKGVAIKYDNGGGQKGERRNPAFDGYNALFKSYVLGLNKLEQLLAEAPGDGSGKASALQSLRLEIGPMRPRADG
ncbi:MULTISPECIES: hypothetical protein [Collinsella]|uniref:Terminase n=1 Tax=Collinsella ihumii TaxID=1720204 RepID=A0ABT7XFR6_9ACTN|nr:MULTISPECIES: hypothetical protein [Collinsella]MDN0055633.1 hypothetical protein [Collinsella ihumii]MDN0064216.1 hypothetical protein [Collinsella ihumii]OUO61511.1 hypothetical protein B5F74_05135 [Collinsella sp. An271]